MSLYNRIAFQWRITWGWGGAGVALFSEWGGGGGKKVCIFFFIINSL